MIASNACAGNVGITSKQSPSRKSINLQSPHDYFYFRPALFERIGAFPHRIAPAYAVVALEKFFQMRGHFGRQSRRVEQRERRRLVRLKISVPVNWSLSLSRACTALGWRELAALCGVPQSMRSCVRDQLPHVLARQVRDRRAFLFRCPFAQRTRIRHCLTHRSSFQRNTPATGGRCRRAASWRARPTRQRRRRRSNQLLLCRQINCVRDVARA